MCFFQAHQLQVAQKYYGVLRTKSRASNVVLERSPGFEPLLFRTLGAAIYVFRASHLGAYLVEDCPVVAHAEDGAGGDEAGGGNGRHADAWESGVAAEQEAVERRLVAHQLLTGRGGDERAVRAWREGARAETRRTRGGAAFIKKNFVFLRARETRASARLDRGAGSACA